MVAKNKTVTKDKRAPAKRKPRTSVQEKQREELEKIRQELFSIVQNTSTIQNNSNPIMSRTQFASRMGMQFDGERDLYATFGYPITLTYEHYRAMYERMGMATRLVEKFAADTWGKRPVLVDGDARSDGVGDKTTPFLDDWNALVKKIKLWQVMRQADIMCGIGRYAVIFLGTAGDYKSPARKGGGLFYVSAYDESQASIKSYIKQTNNELYGMPEQYSIKFENLDNMSSMAERPVHYTRCIHISENRLGSRVLGRPRMQEVFNRLMDLEKVTGGGAEAAWLAVYMGFLLITREGTELPDENSEEWKSLEGALEKFAHRMQRFATLKGVEQVHNLGVHEVRVKDIWTVIMSDLAGSKGIPQRILLGSERGELASSQDMQEWNGVISDRQLNFAEVEMLDPFINFCIANQIIRPPKSGKWTTVWHPVYTPTQIEKADYALRVAQGANQVTNGAPDMALNVNEWRGMLELPPQDMEEIIEEIARLQGIIEEMRKKYEVEPEEDAKDAQDNLDGEKSGNGQNPNGKGVKVPGKNYPKRAGAPNLAPVSPDNQPKDGRQNQ